MSSSGLVALGSRRLSVDDLMDCRVLSTESEKLELRRCLRGFERSAMVEARPNSRLRIGESLCRAVVFALGVAISPEGLIVRLGSMIWSYWAMGEMGLWTKGRCSFDGVAEWTRLHRYIVIASPHRLATEWPEGEASHRTIIQGKRGMFLNWTTSSVTTYDWCSYLRQNRKLPVLVSGSFRWCAALMNLFHS